MKRILAAGSAISLPLALVAACSADEPSDKDSGLSRPSITAAPTATSLNNAGLPLDAYITTGQQQQQYLNALALLNEDCMARFGIRYNVKRSDRPISLDSNAFLQFWPLEKVRQYGYRVSALEHDGLTDKDMHSSLTEEQDGVLTGIVGGISSSGEFKKAATYNGMKIPDGGCQGDARRRLGNIKGNGTPDFRSQTMRVEATERAMSDPKTLQVAAAWSACMKQAGFDYRTPKDAVKGSPPWDRSKPVSQREIQTAVTDMGCKTKVNYVGIMATVRSAYEQQQVEQHAEELKGIRRNIDDIMRNAADVLSGKN